MPQLTVRDALLLPNVELWAGLTFALLVAATVLVSGLAWRRLLRIETESWSLATAWQLALGINWTSFAYYLVRWLDVPQWHLAVTWLPLLAMGTGLAWRMALAKNDSERTAAWRPWRHPFTSGAGVAWRPHAADVAAVLILLTFGMHYLVRVEACVVPDASGVRLYGPLFSDKMTVMACCPALRVSVPPENLRMAGEPFPSHYFPHLFVAAASPWFGGDWIDVYWCYAPLLGLATCGLAVYGFASVLLANRWLAVAALAIYGLSTFSLELRVLDISFALVCLGLTQLGRCYAATREPGSRWQSAATAALAFAWMPAFEVFTALAVLAGLGAWCAIVLLRAMWRRTWLAGDFMQLRWTGLTTFAAGVGAMMVLKLLFGTAEAKYPPHIVWESTFRKSYAHEWRDAASAADASDLVRSIYYWQRGKRIPPPGMSPGHERQLPKAALWQRAVAEVVFDLGYVLYLTARFVNLGLFGIVALWAARSWKHDDGRWAIAAAILGIAIVGYGFPLVANLGREAAGVWWASPNVYRLTGCAHMLLVLLGVGMAWRLCEHWSRPWTWLPIAAAAASLFLATWPQFAPLSDYVHLSHSQLAALDYLRHETPASAIVLHPWSDVPIRNDVRPDEVAWVYKRHFTLGSNLTGRAMYYEGREDYQFSHGAIDPEIVSARRHAREDFYAGDAAAATSSKLDASSIDILITDRSQACGVPASVAAWKPLAEFGEVVIYGRGEERTASAGNHSLRK